jgi:hypothetical protein
MADWEEKDYLRERAEKWQRAGIDWETGRRWERIFQGCLDEANSKLDTIDIALAFGAGGVEDPNEAYLILKRSGVRFDDEDGAPWLLDPIMSKAEIASRLAAIPDHDVSTIGVMLALAGDDDDPKPGD